MHPPTEPTCPSCQYDLTGLAQEGRCPECGVSYDTSAMGPGSKQERFERRMARVRTVLLGSAAVLIWICGGLMQLAGAKQAIATSLCISLIFIMAAAVSFVSEKEAKAIENISDFKPDDVDTPPASTPPDDQWPLPK